MSRWVRLPTSKRLLLSLGALIFLALVLVACGTMGGTVVSPPHIEGASYVGNAQCVQCHTNIARIRCIKHDGVELPAPEFDRMVKTAAGMSAAKRICSSLGISSEEEKFRFGFGI